jgi:hypothetical protein
MAVNNVNYNDTLREGTDKINQSIDQSNQAIDKANTADAKADSAINTANSAVNSANLANTKSDDTQQQLNTIVIESGTSDAEVLQARGTYSVLNERLEATDTQLAEKASQSTVNLRYEQTDYVELIKRHNKFTKMQLKKMNVANTFEVSVFNDQSHLTYEFLYNNDDFMVQTRVWTGGFIESLVAYAELLFTANVTTTGTWFPVNGSIPAYTDTVGDTFSVNVVTENEGDTIAFQFRSTTRSGLWKFTLDGDTENSVTQSMYSELNTDIVYDIFSNVPKGSHTVIGEFLGEDTTKTYTTTVRGWAQSDSRFFVSLNKVGIEPSKDVTLTEPSNKEFAFYIMPQGGTYHQFVPFHGDPTSVEVETAIIKNGNEVIDIDNMALLETVFLDSFSLEQHIYGRHPESGTTNLLEIWSTSLIEKDSGMLSFDGKMKVLQPVTINNSYVIMGTAKGDLFNYVVTSFQNQYFGDSSTYGTNIPMVEERDWAKSYAFLSNTNKNVAVAYRFNNIKETLRQGATGKDESGDTMTYLNNRNDSVKKIYSRLWNSSEVNAGYQMRFSGDYVFGISSNFYDLLSLN